MLEIIGIACIGALWILAEPTIRIREWLLKDYDGVWRRLLECAMCSTFYIAILYKLFVYHQVDIMFAAMASILAELLCKKLLGGL